MATLQNDDLILMKENEVEIAQRSGHKIAKGCVIQDRKLRSETFCKQVEFFFGKKVKSVGSQEEFNFT